MATESNDTIFRPIHGCQRVAIKHEAGGRMGFGVSLKNNRDTNG